MTYKMSSKRYNELRKKGMSHEDVINHVSESLSHTRIKQTHVIAEGKGQFGEMGVERIEFDQIRAVNQVIVYEVDA